MKITYSRLFDPQVGDICVRISTVVKNFTAAREVCKEDGADLAYIPDRFAQQELKELILSKKNIFPHYQNMEDVSSGPSGVKSGK